MKLFRHKCKECRDVKLVHEEPGEVRNIEASNIAERASRRQCLLLVPSAELHGALLNAMKYGLNEYLNGM
jgi:hypothetical protein